MPGRTAFDDGGEVGHGSNGCGCRSRSRSRGGGGSWGGSGDAVPDGLEADLEVGEDQAGDLGLVEVALARFPEDLGDGDADLLAEALGDGAAGGSLDLAGLDPDDVARDLLLELGDDLLHDSVHLNMKRRQRSVSRFSGTV